MNWRTDSAVYPYGNLHNKQRCNEWLKELMMKVKEVIYSKTATDLIYWTNFYSSSNGYHRSNTAKHEIKTVCW